MNEDISLEPLFNQSSVGDGADKRTAFVIIDAVGVTSNRAASAVTNTAEQITIGTGKRSIEIHNSGDNPIYYGGAGVTNSTGIPIYPRQTKAFNNVKDTFSIYIVAETGKNGARKIVEYT